MAKTIDSPITTDTAVLRLVLPAMAGIATYPPGATFGPRRMRDYEFVWMIQGDAEYRRGSTWVSAPQGSIVLCRPGATDFFRWDAKRHTQHGYFHFQLCSAPTHWPAPEAWPLVRTPQGDEILLPLFRYLLAQIGQGKPQLCRPALELFLMAFVTGESGTAAVPDEALPEAVERATQFLYARLEDDPAAPLTLKDLARAACVTPEHLCRVFKDATGRTPLETARLARLDRAATLLARTNYSVGEISAMCGFTSPFHFSRRFKQSYGVAPRNLRQAIRNGSTPPTPRLLKRTLGGDG
jgi:AraC-like DNA-binding protein